MSTAREQLNCLADAFVADIMALSDEEILAEACEDGIDIEANAARMRALFELIVFRIVLSGETPA